MRASASSAFASLREEGARRFVHHHAVGVCLYNLKRDETTFHVKRRSEP